MNEKYVYSLPPKVSLLKSPSVIGGTSLAGAGGAGVGGGQIYEEVNPTLDKQLSKQGYFYSPITSPEEKDSTYEKFKWQNWGCMQKLFPTITIDQQTPTSITEDNLPKDSDILAAPEVKDDLVVCAAMDLRPLTLDVNYPNRIYFKSEVVVRGDNYGWMMGTGLSTVRKGSGSNVGDLNFEYRLILLKKEGNEGKEKGGYSGYNFYQDNTTNVTFFIKPPLEKGGLEKSEKSSTSIPRKTWTGMAIVDTDSASQNKDLLQSINVYLDGSEYAEFFGNDGNFSITNAGFHSIKDIYVPESNNKGWKTISQYNNYRNLSSSLSSGYAPFKNKKLKGKNLKDIQSQCYDWSTKRNHKMSDEDKVGRDICYSKN